MKRSNTYLNRNIYDNDIHKTVINDRSRAVAINHKIDNREKLIIGICLFISILVLSILSFKAFTYAASNDNLSFNTVKKYRSVMIYCGDSVESIADMTYKNNTYNNKKAYEKEIRSINHLNEDTELIPGNYIVIPYYECSSVNITLE